MRRMEKSGTFECRLHVYSWISDYRLGQLLLFKLTQHSDHHYKASKKHPFLQTQDKAPQLIVG